MHEKLKEIRLSLKLTAKEFVTQIEELINVSYSAYCNYENGTRKIPDELYQVLCVKYGVNLNWLIADKGEMFLSDSEKSASQDEQLKEWVVQYVEKTMKDKGL
jgi:transcriptional regulator with XRE-family HTH domain